ncbi:MAG: toll/interleukin-1 receptor domain-containing protein [Nitrospiraceae bacterium]
MHHHLGKIFISHTGSDKPFVRSLAEQIVNHGFDVWLDERDLLVGDPLAENISKALISARVVLAVVSSSSAHSKWLRYELNLATERMVKGLCRIIPVLIDQAALPPEVSGLLYADCRDSLEKGCSTILDALHHESRRLAFEHSFGERAEILLKEVFGSIGTASAYGEYKRRDYDFVPLQLEDADGQEVTPAYEIVSSYISNPQPISQTWLNEWLDELSQSGLSLALLVTERPHDFQVDERHVLNPRVAVRRIRATYDPLDIGKGFLEWQVVVADLTSMSDEMEQKNVLQVARDMLIQCAELEKAESLQRRAYIRTRPSKETVY